MEWLTKRTDALSVDGRIRRRRLRVRWENCVKRERDLMGLGGDWRMRAGGGEVEMGKRGCNEVGPVTEEKIYIQY